jgi:N-methylhydantoinase A
MSSAQAMLVLGIDVGGTFTDVVVRDDTTGRVLVDKVASTPDDQSRGVMQAVGRLASQHGLDTDDLRLFVHGSTVATNALLERKLPRTALLVTAGFGDVLEIGTQTRDDLFALGFRKPAPLVTRELVIEVRERIGRLGDVVEPLTGAEIERVTAAVEGSGAEACAISLLFGFRNGVHERQLAEALRARLPGISIALACEVAPEIGEHARTVTTVVSAAVQPLVSRYLAGVEAGLEAARVGCPLFIMQSSGGVVSAAEAAASAHGMLLSGPAAGVRGALLLAEQTGSRDLITFDMGGTSTDICLIDDGRATVEREPSFDGLDLRIPQLDIHTIGSGGGSIARVVAGLLRVGPESAGAAPGPACYGRGGDRPTVTDAHVALGRVDPARFLGGEMRLDAAAAVRAIRTQIAEPLGMSLEDAALGILDVAEAQMARGVRVVSVNKGHDPRRFALVAFGGAGPMHAAGVGRAVEVGAVVIPTHPGAFSAAGLVAADVRYDLVRAVGLALDTLTPDRVEALFEPLVEEGAARLGLIGSTDVRSELQRIARLRYVWQDNDIDVLFADGAVTEETLREGIAAFHRQHDAAYGYSSDTDRLELIAVCVEAVGRMPRAGHSLLATGADAAEPETRRVCFRETGWTDALVRPRSALPVGSVVAGPAVVEEREATTVVPPGWNLEVAGHGELLLSWGGS